MRQHDSLSTRAGRPGPADRLRFTVTCWVPRQYGDTVDAGTVLEALRHYQEATGGQAAAAAAIATIEAGGPILPAHLETIADALEEDGQAVSTDGEPLAADAAADFTVEVGPPELGRCPSRSRQQPREDVSAPRGINLAGRFTLNEEKAREWLGRIVAAYPGQARDTGKEAPVISAAWHSRSDGAEWTAERLVRGAVGDGILICPDGMDVHFVYESDGDGGSYHFAVDIGHDVTTQVSLATWGYEMRKLGDPDTTGIEAALSILEEAESYSNKALANLALLLAGPDTGPATAQAGFEVTLTGGQITAIRAALAAFRSPDPQLAGDRDSAAGLLEEYA